MPRYAILLRGINLGAVNRLPMAELRAELAQAGLADVETYLQSGNVALSAEQPDDLVARIERLIEGRFGLRIPVMARSHGQLREVVRANPFPEAAQDPKHYQVTFLSGIPDQVAFAGLAQLATPEERVANRGREIYAWHPAAIHSSKLANGLTPAKLGVAQATARNWTTVNKLVEMTADER